MARTVLSLALLACLGLAILHLVSAQEQNKKLEDKTPNNVVMQIKPEEQKVRLLREADPKQNKNKKKCRKGKIYKDGKCVKKGKQRNGNKCRKGQIFKKGKCVKKGKQRTVKQCRKGKKLKNGKCVKKGKQRTGKQCTKGKIYENGKCVKKGKQRTGKQCKKGKIYENGKCIKKEKVRSGRNCKGKKCERMKLGKDKKKNDKKEKDKLKGSNEIPQKRQACDTEALCQKIKDYIKYSNQLRKLRRINKTCSTMEKKRDKASAGEFTASGTANDDSDNATVQAIADKLKNCTSSAKEKCETKVIPACTNTTLNAKCEVELDAWIKKFGPAKGSCLQASASCCACITAISPAPSADCLNFEPLDKASKAKKKECTGSGTDGSFGHCRKLQMEAAEKGPTAHKEKCKNGGGDMTTAKSSGRRMIFRNNLMKKFIKT